LDTAVNYGWRIFALNITGLFKNNLDFYNYFAKFGCADIKKAINVF